MSSIVRSFVSSVCVMGVAVSLAACSAEDDDERDRYRSGVSDDTQQVSTLDEAELEEICESLDVYVDANVGFDAIAYVACIPAAIVLGGTQEGCEAELDRCMSVFPPPIEVQGTVQSRQVCFDDLAACDATVAALEGCVNVNLDVVFDVLDRFTCGRAGDDDLRRDAAAAMDTASVCADVNAACNRAATVVGPD